MRDLEIRGAGSILGNRSKVATSWAVGFRSVLSVAQASGRSD